MNHKTQKLHRIGITLLMVNTDEFGDKRVSLAIKEIFKNYRIYLTERLGEAALYKGLYNELELELFGSFDKVYVFLHDDHELINRFLHPQSKLLKEHGDILYQYKTITGTISEKVDDKIDRKGFIQDTYNNLEKKIKSVEHPFVFFSRLKINSLNLIKGGGASLSQIKRALTFKSQKNEKEFFIIESFGFHEYVLLSFWEDFYEAVEFLKTVRDWYPENVDQIFKKIAEEKEKEKSEKFIYHSLDEPVFDLFSTSFAFPKKIKQELYLEKEISFQSTFSIPPGMTSFFEKEIKAFNIQLALSTLLGWQDTMVTDMLKKEEYKKVAKFIEDNRSLLDSRETIVSINQRQEHQSSEEDNDNPSRRTRAKLNPRREYLMIRQEQIMSLGHDLMEMGVNQVVIQRAIHSIMNFNKSIIERENFTYFLQLKNYLDINFFEFSKVHRPLIREDSQSQGDLRLFPYKYLEKEIIKIIKGFETAFSNRYIHSKELSEVSDTNYAYRGGIQQYLTIYEYLFSSMHARFFQLKEFKAGVSLYVTGYSETVSSIYNMRMNIFQVYNPGLFMVVLSHEVTIHIFDRILNAAFKAVFHKSSMDREERYLNKLGLSDFGEVISLLRLADCAKRSTIKAEDNPTINPFLHSILYKVGDEFPGEEIDKYEAQMLIYHFTDLVTLKMIFMEDHELFVYWHLVYFFQLFGVKSSADATYQGDLMSILTRTYFIFEQIEKKKGNEDSEIQERFTDLIEKLLGNTKTYILCEDVYENKTLEHNDDYLKLLQKVSDNVLDFFQFDKERKMDDMEISLFVKFDSKAEMTGNDEFNLQRRIGIRYLRTIKKMFPKLFIERRGSVYYPHSHNEESRNSTMIIGVNGGINFASAEARVKVYESRMNFFQNMWHLAQKFKRDLLNRVN